MRMQLASSVKESPLRCVLMEDHLLINTHICQLHRHSELTNARKSSVGS
jgi:hypothetical protein